jgi:hypothetical protein
MEPRRAVRLLGEDLPESAHLCAFFRTSEERYRVLLPFIREGLEEGDKAVHIVNPAFRSHHSDRMTQAGIDAARAEVTGQLEVIGWYDGPLRGGRFDQSEWLASLPAVLNNARTQGFAINRFIADMQWLLHNPDVLDRALEFECLATLALPKAGDVVICAYDLDSFGAEMVINALRTHPIVIIGGMVQHNPFYVPPEELLKELSERDSSERDL